MSGISNEANRELMMLRHLKNATGCSNHLGHKHVFRMLDDFLVDGPNGRQLLLAVDYLHEAGVVHGSKISVGVLGDR